MHDDDLAVIDLLCRCQLAARRLGCRIVIRDATDAVREAVAALGFDGILLDPGAEHAETPDTRGRVHPTELCTARRLRSSDGRDD